MRNLLIFRRRRRQGAASIIGAVLFTAIFVTVIGGYFYTNQLLLYNYNLEVREDTIASSQKAQEQFDVGGFVDSNNFLWAGINNTGPIPITILHLFLIDTTSSDVIMDLPVSLTLNPGLGDSVNTMYSYQGEPVIIKVLTERGNTGADIYPPLTIAGTGGLEAGPFIFYLDPTAFRFTLGASLIYCYPSAYNLIGSTSYVSGSLSDLRSDNGVYMQFRSYISSYTTNTYTFGYTSAGSSFRNTEDTIVGSIFTCPDDGQAQSITAYIGMTTAAKNMKCAIYKHSDLSLVAQTEQRSVPISTGWQTFNFVDPKPTLTANTEYLLVAWSASGSGNANLYYYTYGSYNQGHYKSQTYDTNFPNPLSSPTHDSYRYSIYCTYKKANCVSEVEFTGSSTSSDWSWVEWKVDSAWTASSVSVTLQFYNWATSSYPTSGDGYISYTSGSANIDETRSQTITANPNNFREAGTGNWKIKIKGEKTGTQFDFKGDLIQLYLSYMGGLSPGFEIASNADDLIFYVQITSNSDEDIAFGKLSCFLVIVPEVSGHRYEDEIFFYILQSTSNPQNPIAYSPDYNQILPARGSTTLAFGSTTSGGNQLNVDDVMTGPELNTGPNSLSDENLAWSFLLISWKFVDSDVVVVEMIPYAAIHILPS